MTTYHEYLQSDAWRAVSRAAKERAGWMCALCESSEDLETHHRTYARLGQAGELDDLVVLCGRCHRRHHGTFDECADRQLRLPGFGFRALVPIGDDLN